MKLNELTQLTQPFGTTERMPVLFVGHGNPMNALEDNPFTRSLRQAGEQLRAKYPPQAILVVSAHWLTRGTFVNVAPRPETIHDFGGFPDALFAVQYPAPGAPELARETARLSTLIHETDDWGLDHGAWTILHHLFPGAEVPVYQLSIDYYQPMEYHLRLAQQLKVLRRKGVLIIGSGNIVHNLRQSMPRLMTGDHAAYDWATEFDAWTKQQLEKGDYESLTRYLELGTVGKLAVPTPDHYIPLLYSVGLADATDPLQQLYEEVAYGGISMRTFQLG
ncbi:4,5-DOPA dioxygenase extradiol [Rhabdobacter roseus]|uniref:4,5-DOPA dioxygenase extradiol n=1 Tax=Rhabdobacter roseus TaxID=1655419 RepID=A0A840TY85_9BACT|nr:4,5-DOPA dioxygenase extradiol [Rhabdobacter roseus]MBB5286527.1 4,5-DOPA dioxygenase extradiol [Rhabdobacter roseus]